MSISKDNSNSTEKNNLDLKDEFNNYKKEISDFTNGYLILFDIVGSTKRKDEYKYRWIRQTELLYKTSEKLKKLLEDDLKINEKKTFFKTVGDSAFIFLAVSRDLDPENKNKASAKILQRITQFKEMFVEKESITDNLRIKTVITLLEDIYLYKKKDDGVIVDVLGRGIDFSFRIEKYAKDTHIIVNNLFSDSLMRLPKKYRRMKVQRAIKGWEKSGLQTFYSLYNNEDLHSIEISHSEDNIYTEILVNEIQLSNQSI